MTDFEAEPHPYVSNFSFSPVDWTALVQKDSRIHILHGGSKDEVGVYECSRHLCKTWSAGLVIIDEHAHFVEIAKSHAGRVNRTTHLVIVVSAEVVASSPRSYDELRTIENATVIVTIPISTLCGSPYSSKSRIVAVVLPSCRVDMDNVHAVEKVYRFPVAHVLEDTLWVMPHSLGLAWSVGQSTEPSFVSFKDAVDANPAKTREAQFETDRAWYWNRRTSALPVLNVLPRGAIGIVPIKNAPFCPARDPALLCLDDRRLRFITSTSEERLYRLRTTKEVAERDYPCHVIGPRHGVVPVTMSLADTLEEVVRDDFDDPETEHRFLVVTCKMQNIAIETVSEELGSRSEEWKSYSGVH